MIHRGEQLRFALEASQSFFVPGELFGESLDRDFASEFRVPRTPHFTHATFAQGREDFVGTELGARLHCLGDLR